MVILVIILGILCVSVVGTQAQDFPTPPHRFQGYAINQEGELVTADTIISAKLNTMFYNTTVKNGMYGFPTETTVFYVNGTESDAGTIIYFYINGMVVPQTAAYVSGGLNVDFKPYFNLSLDTSSLIISSVGVSSVSTTQAVVTWATNKSANSTVVYGTTTALGSMVHNSAFVKTHQVPLTNLEPHTTYYYEVVSYDRTGHMVRDNHSGQFYQFTTAEETQGGNGGNGEPGSQPGESNRPPHANANGPYYGLVDQPVSFDASGSTDSDGFIMNYTWDFGDAITSSTPQVHQNHTYSKSGNYTVTLTVTDNQGSKNTSRTHAFISTNDSDGDGWSDQVEQLYGTDPRNASDFPTDTDHDGTPDSIDPDNDNDGLTDIEEEQVGTDPFNSSDVLRIINHYGVFFLLDTNRDTIVDTYYNQTTGESTRLYDAGNGTFLLDINGDGIYEYQYDALQHSITPYQTKRPAQDIPLMIILILTILFFILIIGIFVMYTRVRGGKENN